MTISGIIFGVTISLCLLIGTICLLWNRSPVATVIVAIVLIAALWTGLFWYFNNTASGARAIKDQQSNFNNGIERHIVVKDYSGGIIAEYEGKMDIETNNENYILFDDEEGKRHIIYNTTGFILIDEI